MVLPVIMFNQLSSLAHLTANRTQPRHWQSEQHLAQGIALLTQAHEAHFSNPNCLQEACRSFIEAIKYKRTDIRPYLSLAYLFLILEDHQMALKYIKQALAIEPQNRLIKDFQQRVASDYERIKQRRQEIKESFTPVTFEMPDTVDYDSLYDQAETAIRQAVRQVMRASVPDPALDSKEMEAIAKLFESYQQEMDRLHEQLKVIDEEIDIADLTRMMRPLEANRRRYQQLLSTSEIFCKVARQIKEEREMVKQICEEAKSTQEVEDIPVLEENLEALLENAYRYSQELNHLKQQGYTITALETIYGELHEQIESYQDILEETHTRLGH